MPFVIRSAPEHYQKKMNEILEGVEGQISIIDGILVRGKTQMEHNTRLRAVLKKFNVATVTLNLEKCDFVKKEIKFAGYLLNEEGIKSDPGKTVGSRHGYTPDMDTPQTILFPDNWSPTRTTGWWKKTSRLFIQIQHQYWATLGSDWKRSISDNMGMREIQRLHLGKIHSNGNRTQEASPVIWFKESWWTSSRDSTI